MNDISVMLLYGLIVCILDLLERDDLEDECGSAGHFQYDVWLAV